MPRRSKEEHIVRIQIRTYRGCKNVPGEGSTITTRGLTHEEIRRAVEEALKNIGGK